MELLRKTFRRLRAYARERRALRKLHGELDTCNAHLQLQVPFRQFVEARRRTGCEVDEYFAFEFFKKTPEQQETFLTRERRSEVIRAIGDLDMPWTIPGNKLLFNMIFGEFLARDWINPTQASSAEFVRFVREHGEVMIKPALDYGGKGIEVLPLRGRRGRARAPQPAAWAGNGRGGADGATPGHGAPKPTLHQFRARFTYTDCDDVHILFATARSGAWRRPGRQLHLRRHVRSGGLAHRRDLRGRHRSGLPAHPMPPLDGHGAQRLPDPQLGQGAGRGAPRGAQGLHSAPVPLDRLGSGLPGQRRSSPSGRQLEAGLHFHRIRTIPASACSSRSCPKSADPVCMQKRPDA